MAYTPIHIGGGTYTPIVVGGHYTPVNVGGSYTPFAWQEWDNLFQP
ncbi:MAG: hypothetical protein KAQ74_03295 [Dehalococcoidia bacterium]|nr:hypothetical protein [Dehalococcoidia bacterium]